MLKTHWVDFEIFADDVSLYRTEGKRTGFVHLFEVPTGKKLTVQFFHVSEKAADAIEQSDFQIGNRSGIYRMILVKNIHAVYLLCLQQCRDLQPYLQAFICVRHGQGRYAKV